MDSVIELFLSFVLLFFKISFTLIIWFVFMYCILLAIRLPFVNKLDLTWEPRDTAVNFDTYRILQ